MAKLHWVATDLPVEASLPAVAAALDPSSSNRSLVLTAEPGAGKSSLIPLAVANAIPASQRVVVLEPRRLAARATANRLAQLLGDRVGGLVGLTIRGQRSVSEHTRIEVVTEAVLTNRLQADPELAGTGALVFDEFHERNLYSDLGLAMSIEARESLREDLAIVVMSATLDPAPLSNVLNNAQTLAVPGRTFPVETLHLNRPSRQALPKAAATTAVRALDAVAGDVLVFVPGRWEIDRVIGELRPLLAKNSNLGNRVEVVGLHGGTPKQSQQDILRPGAKRRVIVATAVAETSITIPGVEAVVDAGLLRRAQFDSVSGLGRLETRFATRFAADQRRGRAGRTKPGVCFRLWSAEDDRLLDQSVPPSIIDGDPLPVAFELARWGDPDATSLPLLDHPGPDRLLAAREQLKGLGLVEESGALTTNGRVAGRLPLHPRTASLVLRGAEAGMISQAASLAAVTDGDRRFTTVDLERVIDQARGDRDLQASARRITKLLKQSGPKGTISSTPNSDNDLPLDELLASAWPDRVGMARPGRPGRFLLGVGREVEIRQGDPLHDAPFIVVVEADGDPRSARVRLALATSRAAVLAACEAHISWIDEVGFDDRTDKLVAERVQRLGSIVLHRQPGPFPKGPQLEAALRHGIRRRGLDLFTWSDKATSIRQRMDWLHQQAPSMWPDVSDQALLESLDQWLPLTNIKSPAQLRSVDLGGALLNRLDWQLRSDFATAAPTEMGLPTGGSAKVEYSSGRPVWSVRLQRLLGLDLHPTLGPTNVPVTIELLSPAGRPAQTTTDLPGFWRGSYQQVRSDLRGRYPKHDWPEDPLDPGARRQR